MQCKGNRTRCMEYQDGQCLSMGNCMYQDDEEEKEVKQRKIIDIKIDDRIQSDKDIEEILLRARDVVSRIYGYFEKIYKCNEAFKQIDNATVSLLTESGNLIITDDALSKEQRDEISYTVRQMIKCNISDAADKLDMIYSVVNEIHNRGASWKEIAVKDKKTHAAGRHNKLTAKSIPEINALYSNGPFDLKETAAEPKVSIQELKEFVNNNGLEKRLKAGDKIEK